MKKVWTLLAAGSLLASSVLGVMTPVVFADEEEDIVDAVNCIPAEGEEVDPENPTNCAGGTMEMLDLFTLSVENLDFGRATELGRSYTKTFAIKNTGGIDTTYKVSVADSSVANVAANNAQIKDWLVFVGGKTEYVVKNGEQATVSVRIAVPESVAVGTQYAAVVVEDELTEDKKVLEVRLDIDGEGLKYGGEVFGANSSVFSLGTVKASAKVKNTGTSGFVSNYSVKIANMFGLREWEDLVESTSVEVAPGAENEFAITADHGFGIFMIEQTITHINENGEIVETKASRPVIICPLWVLIVAGVVIVALIVLAIVLKKKHAKDDEDDEDEE